MTEASVVQQRESRYLVFGVGPELYGTPLLGVREVVEPQAPKPVPNTVEYFTGVINIRGEIVGVIDLRIKFGQPVKDTPHNALMVFMTEVGPVAALVDKVESVVKLSSDQIESAPSVRTRVPSQYLTGIAEVENRLITIVDLSKILSTDEVAVVRAMSR
ncbi:MAG: chemotaxis protein CheW [Oligoflexia bacterium]|nr:chemotaxis protein CheW [Oligoflexia bacterium]